MVRCSISGASVLHTGFWPVPDYKNIVFFDYKKLRFFTKENPVLTRADHRSYRCFEVGYPPIRACSAGRYRCAITILKWPVPNVP